MSAFWNNKGIKSTASFQRWTLLVNSKGVLAWLTHIIILDQNLFKYGWVNSTVMQLGGQPTYNAILTCCGAVSLVCLCCIQHKLRLLLCKGKYFPLPWVMQQQQPHWVHSDLHHHKQHRSEQPGTAMGCLRIGLDLAQVLGPGPKSSSPLVLPVSFTTALPNSICMCERDFASLIHSNEICLVQLAFPVHISNSLQEHSAW